VRAPATIGLIGGFGIGKTTVANLLREQLLGHESLAVVILSVEKHQGTSRQRALVYAIGEALENAGLVAREDIGLALARLEHTNSQTAATARTEFFADLWKARGKWWLLALVGTAAAVFGIGFLVAKLSHDPNPTFWFTAITGAVPTGVTTAGALLIRDFAKEWLKPGSVTHVRARAEAPDEIERVFQDLVSLCKRKLVIVVENLDRLDESDVLDAIGAIRSLGDVPRKRPPIFVVPCDESILQRALAQVAGGTTNEKGGPAKTALSPHQLEGRENLSPSARASAFMDKWFSLRLHMPPALTTDLRSWADRLLQSSADAGPHTGAERLKQADHLDHVLDVLLHDEIANQRHLIKRLNSFFAQYRLACIREASQAITPGTVAGNPLVLARLVVLRDDYPELYERVRREHALMWALDQAQSGNDVDDEVEDLIGPYLARSEDGRWQVRADAASFVPSLRYLKGTVGLGGVPKNLAPFLYLAQTEHSRFIGSETADALRRELENGDLSEIRARFVDAADDRAKAANIAGTVVDTIREARRGLKLANAVRTAATLLSEVPNGLATTIANALARRLADHPEAVPNFPLLANIILATEASYRNGLTAQLLSRPTTNSGERTLQGIAILRVAADSEHVAKPVSTKLASIWQEMSDEPDWPAAQGWLAEAELLTLASNKISGGLPVEFFTGMLNSMAAAESAPVSVAPLDSLLTLNSRAARSPEVLSAAASLGTRSDPDLAVLGLRLVQRLDLPDTADVFSLVRQIAEAFEGGAVNLDALFAAVAVLHRWLPTYVDLDISDEDEDEDEVAKPASTWAATVFTDAAEFATEAEAEPILDALRAFMSNKRVADAATLTQGLLRRVIAGAPVHDAVASMFLAELRVAAPQLPAAADAVEMFVKDVLTSGHVSSSPEVKLALETLAIGTVSGALSGKLPALTAGWVTALPNTQLPAPGQWEHLADAIRLTISQLPAKYVAPFESRLRTYAGAEGLRSHALHLLVHVTWPESVRDQVTADFDAFWTTLTDSQRSRVIEVLVTWNQTPIPPGLSGRIVAHFIDYEEKWSFVPLLWKRLQLGDRADLVTSESGDAGELLKALADEDAVTIQGHLVKAQEEGQLPRVARMLAGLPAAHAAARSLIDTMRAGTAHEWDEHAVRVLMRELYDEELALAHYGELPSWLREGAGEAHHAAVVLSELATKYQPSDRAPIKDAIAHAIASASDDTVASLWASAKAANLHRGVVTEARKERRKSKGLLATLLGRDSE